MMRLRDALEELIDEFEAKIECEIKMELEDRYHALIQQLEAQVHDELMWRQIVADLLNVNVILIETPEDAKRLMVLR